MLYLHFYCIVKVLLLALSTQRGDNPTTYYKEAAALARGAGIKNVVGSALFGLGHASGSAGDEVYPSLPSPLPLPLPLFSLISHKCIILGRSVEEG